MKRVAIVEDEIIFAEYLSQLCHLYGAKVVGMAHDAKGAQSLILEKQPDFVLMDLALFDHSDGTDVAREVRKFLPGVKIVFVTGASDPDSLGRIGASNPYDVLFKPVHPDEIQRVLR